MASRIGTRQSKNYRPKSPGDTIGFCARIRIQQGVNYKEFCVQLRMNKTAMYRALYKHTDEHMASHMINPDAVTLTQIVTLSLIRTLTLTLKGLN